MDKHTILAYDENGNSFTKKVSFRNGMSGPIISFGSPMEFYIEDILSHPPQDPEKFYLDAAGRNHKGSPVYCSTAEVLDMCKSYIEKKESVLEAPEIIGRDGPHPCGEENRYGVQWSGVSITTNTAEQLQKLIDGYQKKFWHVWIDGENEFGKPSAFLFKPKDCRCEWYEPDDLDRRKPLTFDDPAEGIRLLGNNIMDIKSLQVYLKAVEDFYPKFMTLGGVSNRNNSLWSTYIAMDDQKNIKYLNIGHDGTPKWEDIDPETAQKRLRAAYFERIIGEWGIDKIGAQPSLFDAVEAVNKMNSSSSQNLKA